MPTYKQIMEDVWRRTGRSVSTCHIAEVKRELGLTTRGGMEPWTGYPERTVST